MACVSNVFPSVGTAECPDELFFCRVLVTMKQMHEQAWWATVYRTSSRQIQVRRWRNGGMAQAVCKRKTRPRKPALTQHATTKNSARGKGKTKHVMYATPCRICENLVELNNPPASCIPDCFAVATISLAPVGVASTTYPFVMIHAQCPVKICKHIIPAKFAFRAFHYFAEACRNQDGVVFSFCHFGSNLLVPLFRIKCFGSAT